MDFEVQDVVARNGVLVVAVRGELDLDSVGELRRRMGLRFGDTVPAVIDLSECTFIDSTGLSLLVRACKRAEEEGLSPHIIVALPDSQVRRTLRLTNLDGRMPVMDSRNAAVEAVGPRRLTPAQAPARDGRPASPPTVR